MDTGMAATGTDTIMATGMDITTGIITTATTETPFTMATVVQ
jgi:hypothetical protein